MNVVSRPYTCVVCLGTHTATIPDTWTGWHTIRNHCPLRPALPATDHPIYIAPPEDQETDR